ncbi:MAG: hypothetical protein ACUBOA_00555 [Candidatus Loosdrechtia sp.]|uniref:hypothetical protein n=1 Tax=Candidatus Loosdrechtia sp. TaxID=3101272 RepID=UPI003A63C20B|nr:MAG: hypothetical protein QY305_13605 [Candidatus Jettenia sp. AMX2]
MEFILKDIKDLAYIYREVFWLKECLITLKSLVVFLLVRWMLKLGYKRQVFLYLGAFIGVVCVFFGDMEYLSENDILKLIAPTSLLLLLYNKNQKTDSILIFFLIPYLIISYEFYRNWHEVTASVISHALIISCIIVSKDNMYLSLFISTVIGILFNLIGHNSQPGTNELFLNPALITLVILGIGHYTKNSRYTDFLKSFWITLLGFAYLGSWIFYFIKLYLLRYNVHHEHFRMHLDEYIFLA